MAGQAKSICLKILMKSEGRREKICEDSEIPDITMEYLSHAENIKIDKLSFWEMKLAN